VQGPVRVVLADGHHAFLQGLTVVLKSKGNLEIVALASDSREVLRTVWDKRPEVLVLDAQLPGMDPDEMIQVIKESAAETRVLMLSADARGDIISRLLRGGADAFVSKEVPAWQVVDAIEKVAAGTVTSRSYGPWTSASNGEAELDLLLRSLSRREREVLSLLAAGYSNPSIAEKCSLSLNTVRTHVQNVLAKLGVHSKLAAAAFASEHGIVWTEES
jgi:two-component system nitrate/nitrite response regulator NarL